MMQALRGFGLCSLVVLVSTLAAAPNAAGASTPSTAANVYIQIQGPEGSVYGFHASPTGKLNVISGSPFKPAGLIIASTPTKFFTQGQELLHSYAVGYDGAILSQIDQYPYVAYSGGDCSSGTYTSHDAVLDHTGKFIYTLQQNGSCAVFDSIRINSDESFFGMSFATLNTSGGTVNRPSILGNETYAYASSGQGHNSSLVGFWRESWGALDPMRFSETDPALPNGYYSPASPDASPDGHYVVVQLYPYQSEPPQLGSYTVGSLGNLSTSNTSSNMPTSSLYDPQSTFSPAGDMVVLCAEQGVGNPVGTPGGGIEIYRFNGAAPLSLYKTLLKGTPINQVAWDKSHHLYAISRLTNKLYVFTVTATSVTEDTAWSIGSPFRMIVVSQ